MMDSKPEQGQEEEQAQEQEQRQGQGQGQEGGGGESGNLAYEEALHHLAVCDAVITNLIDEALLMEMEVATIMVDMISMNDLLIFKHLEDEELDLVTEVGLKKFADENKKDDNSI